MRTALTVILLFFFLPLLAQDVINIDGVDCGMHGSAHPGSMAYQLDGYKNRYNFPQRSDFDTTIQLKDLAASGDPNQFSPEKAVVIRGYVYDVKVGGVETCNCKTKDIQYRDTHIELVVNPNQTGPESRIIVEVTPRLRAIMEAKGADWSTQGLRQTIKGHQVEVAGWLMYDAEHETEAFANDPDDQIGRHNWRATCWEVHPITYLKVIDNGSFTPMNQIAQQQAKQPSASAQGGQTGHRNYTGLIIVLLILVIVVWVLWRRK
jgi:hypothetical protein